MGTLPAFSLLRMPALSPTMTGGTISKWSKKPGEEFGAGDVLAEVGTDKATVSWEMQESGVLARILVESGDALVNVGDAVAVAVEDKASVAAIEKASLADLKVTPAGGAKSADKPTPAPPAASAPASAPPPAPPAAPASSPAKPAPEAPKPAAPKPAAAPAPKAAPAAGAVPFPSSWGAGVYQSSFGPLLQGQTDAYVKKFGPSFLEPLPAAPAAAAPAAGAGKKQS